MGHFLQEDLTHVILKEVWVESALSDRVSHSCSVATSLSREILRKRPGDTKVTNLDSHVSSHEKVRWFYVSVDHI